ncbi:rod shape-determining protein [Streptobacillus moniliformis]|uniref:Cell shape-determining protein MreB n=1 Tax=Streptobacillus moniliformis (strain ATCC 14647 / DSM 12112 / NCTC 10651 / 9901) TaxID=519441 RepID=D1AWM7_STRM9|nr:rod shape-determining protein [Streptobacillus moniliformis]ACZ00703.1 cell shape determining protein MreB/Mrl [Streptobacillus moniliformis DSM 12112]AVL42898.1 rod shape-determining protein [Streptobacillus moniliformis]QXW65462.1 rod shape-determining protein [Streptobacillus moniliformis]SQA14169.1 Rod shape-determining protein MreB [Streptobacillus moniliformis]
MIFNKIINFFRIKKQISIDLGTSNVLFYDKQAKKIVLNEPSVIVKDKKTDRVVAVGREAREMLGKNPKSIEVIKPLKDGVISDIDLTRKMLSEFMRQVYGISPFKPEVIICVPIEVTKVERRALFDALDDVKRIFLIEEGRAAIMGAGINISNPNGHMVIDIGGGSTDVAILSLDEIIVSKSIKIAGNKFDEDIVKYVKEKLFLNIGDRTAEKIKKELSTAIFLPEEENKKMTIKGLDINTKKPKELVITSNQVCEAIEDSLNNLVAAVKEVIGKCPPELASDILDNGIVLTGGGALISNLYKLIENEVKVNVHVPDKPLDSVAIGGSYAFDNKNLLNTLLVKEN